MKKQNTKRDIDFFNNCKLGVYPKFLIFNLLNVSNKDTLSIRKRLLCSVINKNFNMFQKDSVCPKCLSKQLSTTDFYILTKFITSHNKKSLQKSLDTQQKMLSSLTRDCSLLYSQLTKLLITSCNMNYLRKNPIYLKQLYTKFNIFNTFDKIDRSFINNLKSHETKSQIKAHLLYPC